MSFALAATLREEILDRLFGGQAMTALPTDWQLSLWTGDPLASGVEVTGTSYARQTLAAANWEGLSTLRSIKLPVRWPATGTAGAGGWTAPLRYLGLSAVGDPPLIAILGYQGAYTSVADGEYAESAANAVQFGFYTTDTGTNGAIRLATSLSASILSFLLGGGAGPAFAVPSDWEVSLWTGNPLQGQAGYEVYDPEYARLTIPNDLTNWEAASAGKKNLTGLRWPATGTPAREWGRITYVGLSSTVGGDPVIAVPMEPRTLRPGTALDVAAGDINIVWFA